jgi:hypothetical protein
MVDLNKFADKNQNKFFFSLALDNEIELTNYLKDKNSKYIYVANQKKFIESQLKSNTYPTHFLIKNGIVKKVFGRANELINYVEKYGK